YNIKKMKGGMTMMDNNRLIMAGVSTLTDDEIQDLLFSQDVEKENKIKNAQDDIATIDAIMAGVISF
ncbi:MAG: hypothetical protein K2N27_07525, partial [Ruminococcus sp.]|nr:hypothetical protein [Ruminococcus sp.]